MKSYTTLFRKIEFVVPNDKQRPFQQFLLAAFLLLLCASPAGLMAQTLYQYTNTGSPITVNSGITATALTRGAGVGATGLECSGPAAGFSGDGFTTASANAAVNNDDYIEFSILPNSGVNINITGFQASLRRENSGTPTAGPSRVRYRYSTNNGTTWSSSAAVIPDPNVCGTAGVLRVWAGFPTITNQSTKVIFRIFGWSGTASGDLEIQNILVTGTTNCTTPLTYAVSPSSATVCAGAAQVVLSSSQVNVSYQLRRNGTNLGTPISGDGNPLTFTGLTQSGTYTVVASTSATCTALMSGSAVLNINAAPTASISPATAAICSGQSATLTASGGGTYAWSTGATTVAITASPVANTTYTVTVSNTNGCTATSSRTVTVTTTPTAFNLIGSGTTCNSIFLTLNGSQTGVNYQLKLGTVNDGAFIPGTGNPINFGNKTAAGTYTVVATPSAGGTCTATMNGSVVLSTGLALNISGPTTAECGNNVVITVKAAGFCSLSGLQYSLNWDASKFSYVSHSAPLNIGGSVAVLTPVTPVNTIQYLWSDGVGACDGAVLANTTLMTLVLQAKGCTSANSNITFSGVLATNCSFASVPVTSNSLAVTVGDNTPPSLSAITGTFTAECSLTVNRPTATDCNTVTFLPADLTKTITAQGTTTVTWIANDGCGNTASVSQVVTVDDNTFPTMNCSAFPANVTISTEIGRCDANFDYSSYITATNPGDNCGTPTLTFSKAPGANFLLGTTPVTVTAEDGGGNQTSCTFNVTVRDDEAPTITCPDNLVDYATTCSRTISTSSAQLEPIVDDNCTGTLILTHSVSLLGLTAPTLPVPPNLTFSTGLLPSVVRYRITDAAGNSAECFMTVEIIDNTKPSFGSTCPPATQFFPAAASCTTAVSINVVATDNCGTPTVTPTPSAITSLPVGTHTYAYTATDGSGNTATCNFTVVVADVTPPSLTCTNPSNITTSTCSATSSAFWNENSGGVITFSDNCGTPSILQISGPPSNGTFNVGKTVITYQATDASGLTATCTFTVTVTESIAPTINTCPSAQNINIGTAAGCNVTIPDVTIGLVAGDNCSSTNLVVTQSPVAGTVQSTSHNTVIPVTITVVDASGNPATCVVNLTAKDITRPSLTCPVNVTQAPDATGCDAVVNGLNPTYSDNCIANLSYTRTGASSNGSIGGSATGSIFNSGTTTVTYTVTDGVTVDRTCSFTVTITTCNRIRGTITWAHAPQGVQAANVALNLGGGSDLTNANGVFAIFPAGTGPYTITPTRSLNPLNGVTVADATAINNHILGGAGTYPNSIVGAYQRIESDVNKDGLINNTDAAIVRQAITGNVEAQAFLTWRFVPTSHTFPSFTSPWGFPETRTGVAVPSNNQDFKGMKLGDPAFGFVAPLSPEQSKFTVTTEDRLLETGTEISVDFAAMSYSDLIALQLALDFDRTNLELLSAEGLGSTFGLNGGNFGLYQKELGEVRVVMSRTQGFAVAQNSGVFRLRFKVLQGEVKLSEVLKINNEIIPGFAYNSLLQEADVQLVYTDAALVSGSTDLTAWASQPQLLQNQPNPFENETVIGFILPEAGEATLNIYDQTGRLVFNVNNTYPTGYNTIRIESGKLSGVGLYQYELVTSTTRLARKMVLFTRP